MDYSPEAFAALWDEIEHQGGAMLPDACVSQDVVFTVPPYAKKQVLKGSKREGTCGCKNESRFVSTYKARKKRASGEGFVTACAVCDSVGAWPRYVGVVLAADPNMRDQMTAPEPEDDD